MNVGESDIAAKISDYPGKPLRILLQKVIQSFLHSSSNLWIRFRFATKLL